MGNDTDNDIAYSNGWYYLVIISLSILSWTKFPIPIWNEAVFDSYTMVRGQLPDMFITKLLYNMFYNILSKSIYQIESYVGGININLFSTSLWV